MPPLAVPKRSNAQTLVLSALLVVVATASPSCSTAPKGNDAKGQKAYGAYMARRGYWREALFRFRLAAALRPNDPEILNDLAVAHESLGETAEALAAYKKALELAPQDSQIRRNYARFAEYYTAAQRPATAGAVAP